MSVLDELRAPRGATTRPAPGGRRRSVLDELRDDSPSAPAPKQTWAEWATTGLLNPLAERASTAITTPRLNESPTVAKLKGFLGGAMEGASQAFTSPLDIGLTVAGGPVARGIGKSVSALSKLVRGSKAIEPAVDAASTLAKSRALTDDLAQAITPSGFKMRTSTKATVTPKATVAEPPPPVLDPRDPPVLAFGERRAAPRATGPTTTLNDMLYGSLRQGDLRFGVSGEASGLVPKPFTQVSVAARENARGLETAVKQGLATPSGAATSRAISRVPELGTSMPTMGTATTKPRLTPTTTDLAESKIKRGALRDQLVELGQEVPHGDSRLQKQDILSQLWRQAQRSGDKQAAKQAGKASGQHARSLLKSESGGVDPALLADIGGAAAGGAYGASGEDLTPEERVLGGLGGAFVGGGLAGGTTRRLRAGQGLGRATFGAINDTASGGLLAGKAVFKAGLGAAGALVTHPLDVLFGQGPRAAGRALAAGAKAVPEAIVEGVKAPFRSISRAGSPLIREAQGGGGIASIPARVMAGPDAFARTILEKQGLPVEEANRLLLSGDSQSQVAQDVIRAAGHPISRLIQPFVRTSMNSIEQGIQRTPLLNLMTLGKSAGALRQTPRQVIAKTGTSLASLGAVEALRHYYQNDAEDPDQAGALIEAAAGPNVFPAAVLQGMKTGLGVESPEDLAYLGEALGDPETLKDVLAAGAEGGFEAAYHQIALPLRTPKMADILERMYPRVLKP